MGDRLDRPLILDIGCGAGASAIPLARLSRGNTPAELAANDEVKSRYLGV